MWEGFKYLKKTVNSDLKYRTYVRDGWLIRFYHTELCKRGLFIKTSFS